MKDVYTWSDDMYPIVKKYFDERYNSRVNFISEVAGVVKQEELSYDIEGLGGYGELPVYSGTITITEGKKHQVKRMIRYAGNRVLYLKRLSIAGLTLDTELRAGEYRALTEEELTLLRGN